MEHVTHHGRRIAYRVSEGDGEEPAILFVHGSGGTHTIWKAQARLRDTAPVVSLDLSGHGESEDVDAEPGPETLAAYADDVVAVAEETDATVFCGNSLGGAVVLQAVISRGLSPAGVVLAGTGAKLTVLEDLLRWLEDDFDRAVEWLHDPDRLFHDPDDRTLEASREAMRAAGQRVTHRDFATSNEFDVRGDLDRVDVPALAVVGEHDGLTPPWYHEALAESIPDCDLAVIESAAHLTMLERPEAFNAAVETFLDRL